MESIIAVNIKSFPSSNSLISDHQFGFTPGHSTLDMLLLLYQQWWRPSISDMRSEVSLWTFLDILIHSGIPPCSPNSLPMECKANSTLGKLTSSTLVVNVWLSTEPFHLLSVKAGVPQGNVIGHKLFVIFINDLTDSGKSSISADDSTLCHDISHPSDRRAEVSPLSSDLDKITNWSNTILLMYPCCPPFTSSFTCIPCLSVSGYFLPPLCCCSLPILLPFPSLCCVPINLLCGIALL